MDYKQFIKDKKEHPVYGGPEDTAEQAAAAGSPDSQKKFLGVRFECCGVYTRAYRNKDGTAYVARCPRCLQQVTIGIDNQKGIDARFFVVRNA
jgi:hypothetical protein